MARPGARPAVQQFIAGWVARLHQRGYTAGLYSSLAAGIVDQVGAFQAGMPDGRRTVDRGVGQPAEPQPLRVPRAP